MAQYFKSPPSRSDVSYVKYDVTDNISGTISTVTTVIQRPTLDTPSTDSQPIAHIQVHLVSGSINDNPPIGTIMNKQVQKVLSEEFQQLFLTASQEEYDTFINSTFELYKTL
jgi:hypothetical protein